MKIFVIACVLVLVAVSSGEAIKCGKGEHVFSTDCGPLLIEPTCDNPHPAPLEAYICDYQSCFCDSPTVRELVSNKCVPLDKCPTTDFQQWFKEHPELHAERQQKDKKSSH